MAGGKAVERARKAQPVAVETESGADEARTEPLNFRVTPSFAMEFRLYAVKHKLKHAAVLERAFAALLRGK